MDQQPEIANEDLINALSFLLDQGEAAEAGAVVDAPPAAVLEEVANRFLLHGTDAESDQLVRLLPNQEATSPKDCHKLLTNLLKELQKVVDGTLDVCSDAIAAHEGAANSAEPNDMVAKLNLLKNNFRKHLEGTPAFQLHSETALGTSVFESSVRSLEDRMGKAINPNIPTDTLDEANDARAGNAYNPLQTRPTPPGHEG